MRRPMFCDACGAPYAVEEWPRVCLHCSAERWNNPTTVVVGLLPVWLGDIEKYGVLTVQRAIAPYIGRLALPGGFVDVGETLEEAIMRECLEECGALLDPTNFHYSHSFATPNGHTLAFMEYGPKLNRANFTCFTPNSEVLAWAVSGPEFDLCFPSHNEAAQEFYDRINDKT